MLDVAYVGNHGFNRLRAFQGGANGAVDLNAVDIGAAYLPENQDPTLGTSSVPGATAYTANLLRAFRGWQQHQRAGDAFLGRVSRPSRSSVNRRFRNGLAFGTNYTLGLSLKGNTGLQLRLQHAADGTISVRSDQAEYEALNENLALQRHVIKSYAVWDIPKAPRTPRAVGATCSTTGSCRAFSRRARRTSPGPCAANGASAGEQPDNGRYDLTYTYQNNGTNTNLTGSPDYAAKIVYRRRSGHRAARATSTRSSTRRPSPGRPTAASASSRAATSSAAAPITPSTWRSPSNIRFGGNAQPPVPLRRVQRVQRGDHQRPQSKRDLSEPDGPDRSSTRSICRTARSIRRV